MILHDEQKEELYAKIQVILFYMHDPVSFQKLSELLEIEKGDLEVLVQDLNNRTLNPFSFVITNQSVQMVTHAQFSDLIEKVKKDEVTKDLSKAALETLSIVLYKKNVTRTDIDFIRGVNSSVILRNLMMRGLIEKSNSASGRGSVYVPSHKLLNHLGVTQQEALQDFEKTSHILEDKIAQFKNSNNETSE